MEEPARQKDVYQTIHHCTNAQMSHHHGEAKWDDGAEEVGGIWGGDGQRGHSFILFYFFLKKRSYWTQKCDIE